MNNNYSPILVIAFMVFACVAASPANAQARNYEMGIEAGVGATDNIGRTPDTPLDPALDEVFYLAGLNFMLEQEARRWSADFRGSIRRIMYENQIFDDETLATLSGGVSLTLVDERLFWFVDVNHGQQIINPFQPVTPDNREDVTYLTTGPRFSIPLGVRTYLTGRASYSDVSYELRPFDNERADGRLGIMRDIAPTKSVSLNVSANRIEYDLGDLYPPIDRQTAYLTYTSDDSRNDFSVSIGWNRIERDGDEGDGLLLELDWSRDLSAISSMSLNLGSNYSTNGDIFRLSQRLDDIFRGTQDIQGVDDPFRHDYARLAYTYRASRTTVRTSMYFSQETYENSVALDRSIGGVDLSIRREFTKHLNGSIFGRFITRDYENTDSQNDDSSYGISIGWNFSKAISLDVRFEQFSRSTSGFGSSYDENRALLIFNYVPIRS